MCADDWSIAALPCKSRSDKTLSRADHHQPVELHMFCSVGIGLGRISGIMKRKSRVLLGSGEDGGGKDTFASAGEADNLAA